MDKNIILSCLTEGDFKLHSGQKSRYMFDVMKLIADFDFQQEFCRFIDGDFLVGIEYGGSILSMLNGNEDFAIIRKDGTIYGSPIPEDYVLLDDVVTTENTLRKAMEHLFEQTGHYPDEIKCIVDRRENKNRSLHIESMLEFNENEYIDKKQSERIRRLREQLPESQKCSMCHNPLFDHNVSADAEPHRISGDPVCKKCYFDSLGDEIEKHPIGSGYLLIDEFSKNSGTFRRRR